MTERYQRSRPARVILAKRALVKANEAATQAMERLLEIAVDAPNVFERARLRVMAEQAQKAAYLVTERPRLAGLPKQEKGRRHHED